MKYLSLNLVDTTSNPYPEELSDIKVAIRGSKNLFNIFFKADDIEDSFKIAICPTTDFTWLLVDSEHERYVSYPILKRMLYAYSHPLVKPYLEWVDGLLFSNKVKALYNAEQSPEVVIDISDTDDDSICSYSSGHSYFDSTTDDYLVASFQYKIQQLEHAIELKDKDLDILDREIIIRDEKIKLLNLQIASMTKATWV